MGKMQRDKGSRYEREIVNTLKDRSIPAKRVPLSGADQNFKGDVLVGDQELKGECKRRKGGFKFIYDNIADNDLLFIRTDHSESLVVMTLDKFIELWWSVNK